MQRLAFIGGQLRALVRRQCGQGLAEYALILVLISIVAIVVMQLVGNSANTMYQTAGNALVNP